LLEVACRADPNPVRERLRQPELWKNPDTVRRLLVELKAAELSPQMATTLARFARARDVEAITLLTAVYARVPQDFWLNFELGIALSRAHRGDEALSYLRVALALRPDSSAAHTGLGMLLQEMGHTDEAIDHYQQALSIDPRYAVAHYNFADALRRQGKLDAAIGHFREAIAIDPKFTLAYVNLGVALQSKDRMDEAIDAFKEAIRLDDASAVAHNDLATVLRRKGRLDEAIPELQQAVTIDPSFLAGQINLAEALRARGRLEEAIDHFQKAARLQPEDAGAQVSLCMNLYEAAQEAARASMGAGDAERLDESARVNLRRRALDWLRASLDLATKLVSEGQVQPSSLAFWQKDPMFSAVREPAELAKLPEEDREQWQRLWADVAAQIANDPLAQGRAHAARRQWDRAADAYARTLRRGAPNDGHFWFEYAAVSLLVDDRPGYARACTYLIEACGKPAGPRPYHMARACTLAQEGVSDSAMLGRLAQKELQANARQFWSLTEKGALAYRAGRFDESVALFEQSLRADPKPGRAVINWLWLGLAHQRLGKTEEARRWQEKAGAWLDQYVDGMPPRAEAELGLDLHNWLEAQILRREAEAIIAK
jgi:tetratricopeptide (TPR) repeat protein